MAPIRTSRVRRTKALSSRDSLILGSGIHGLEMADLFERVNALRPRNERRRLLGFLARRPEQVGSVRNGYSVLGTVADLERYPDAELFHDNEWPVSMPIPLGRLGTLIDPSAFIATGARVGPGSVIYPHCFVGANAVIGREVFMLSGCIVNHDDVIGDRTVLASAVTLAGAVTVGEDCYLGQSCSVREGLQIGRDCLIGMGAVVIASVEPNSVMVGNPARRLRDHRAPVAVRGAAKKR